MWRGDIQASFTPTECVEILNIILHFKLKNINLIEYNTFPKEINMSDVLDALLHSSAQAADLYMADSKPIKLPNCPSRTGHPPGLDLPPGIQDSKHFDILFDGDLLQDKKNNVEGTSRPMEGSTICKIQKGIYLPDLQ